MIAVLLMSPRLYWVFKLILAILLSEWSSFCLFSKTLGTAQSASSTIANNVTFIFHTCVLWQDLSICLSFRFLSFSPCGPPQIQNPLDDWLLFFFFLINTRYFLLVEIKWFVPKGLMRLIPKERLLLYNPLRVFHIITIWWSFTGVVRTLLIILTNLNNAAVWMVSTPPPPTPLSRFSIRNL